MDKENTDLKELNNNLKTKDSPVRSILKAFSWRIIASSTTFLITFVIFRRYSEKSLDEVLETATFITTIDVVAKLAFYYLHERLWTNIRWGKYWRRTYWRSKAWKKLYNKMHAENN
jgi:uncharacterized membrane protein